MDEQISKTYEAIRVFVSQLNTGFGKKYRPVALYNRLLEKTELSDKTSVNRHIQAFKDFYENNPDYIKTKKLGTNCKISYNDRIFIDIYKVHKKLGPTAHSTIHKHLITIYSLININNEQGTMALQTLRETGPSNDGSLNSPLEGINLPATKEGDFIKETLSEMAGHLQGLDAPGDDMNPMLMMSQMMQSGFLSKFMGDIKDKFSSGEMDVKSLMNTVTGIISETTANTGEDMSQMQDFVAQSMSTMAAMTGGEMPEEVQDIIPNLFAKPEPDFDDVSNASAENNADVCQVDKSPEEVNDMCKEHIGTTTGDTPGVTCSNTE